MRRLIFVFCVQLAEPTIIFTFDLAHSATHLPFETHEKVFEMNFRRQTSDVSKFGGRERDVTAEWNKHRNNNFERTHN